MFSAQDIDTVERALVRKDSTVRDRLLTAEDVPAVVRIAWRYEFFREDITVVVGPGGYVIEFRFGPDAQGPWLTSGLVPFEELRINFDQSLTGVITDILVQVNERMQRVRTESRLNSEKRMGRR